MSTARIPDGTPLGLVQVGADDQQSQLTVSGLKRPVKPTSEVAHQPGQQPAAAFCPICPEAHLGYWGSHPPRSAWRRCHELGRCGLGSAVECSTERSRAPDRQPVAPVEGRAWETPATRTV